MLARLRNGANLHLLVWSAVFAKGPELFQLLHHRMNEMGQKRSLATPLKQVGHEVENGPPAMNAGNGTVR